MKNQLMQQVEDKFIRTDLPKISVGDTVDVHCRIIEGEKERVQVFTGVVLSLSGAGVNRMMIVRRIVDNEGVERIFPMCSPKIAKVEIKRRAHTRRAKLYYLRDRVGKAQRLRDKRRGLTKPAVPGEAAPAAEAAPKA